MKTRLHLVLNLILSAILIGFLVVTGANERLPEIFSRLDTDYCLGFAVLSLIGLVFRAVRYQLLLSVSSERASFFDLLLITGIRNVLVDLLPARIGEGALVYFLARTGIKLVTSFALLVLTTLCDLIVLAILVLPFTLKSSINPIFPAMRGVVLIVLLLLPAFLVNLPKIFRWMQKLFPKWHLLEECISSSQRLATFPVLLKVMLLTVILRVSKYGGLYLLFRAVFGAPQDIPASRVIAAFIGAEASASLPASGIMGFGAYEVVWGTILSGSLNDATSGHYLASIFAIHLITQLLACAVGAMCMVLLALRTSNPRSNVV